MLSKLGILHKLIVAIFILGSDDSVAATKPQCQRKCGNVSIPYPFGIGEHCCRNAWFEITCQNHIPVLQVYQMKVLNISFSQIRVANNQEFTDCNPEKESWTNQHIEPLIKREFNPFFFPHTSNKLVAVGCDIYSFITEANEENYETGCLSLCKGPIAESAAPFCSGFHCCQTLLTRNFRSIRVQILNVSSVSSEIGGPRACSSAFLAEAEQDFRYFPMDLEILARLSWVVGKNSCKETSPTVVMHAAEIPNALTMTWDIDVDAVEVIEGILIFSMAAKVASTSSIAYYAVVCSKKNSWP
ncbi:hypothetical protein Patl1_09298 [Pistacia atlantica]|uniref:Uncharacterized protein n=1 Tax=Pistacia atlantica TaxID=434234 RepID=A0ACC1AKE5_9ROSI|nr:hypothetical protein Patl1_09298 [Pistacia atlantica]